MITLRPYQESVVTEIRAALRAGSKAPLLVLPTGGGKTVCFSYIAQSAAAKQNRVGIMVHRTELVDQVSETLKQFDVPHGIVAAGYSMTRAAVQVCSVQTYVKRPNAPKFDLVIADEAHHAIGGSTWDKARQQSGARITLGVTATPERLDGTGLGQVFDRMILGPTVAELITLGALSPYRLFAPSKPDLSGVHSRMGDYIRAEADAAMDRPSITGDAVSHYRRLADGKRAVAFCCSVAHAGHVAQEFMAAGYTAIALDGGMDRQLRRQVVADFKAGVIQVLTSCDLISEGFDLPAIEATILLRPTQSLGLYLQQVGRGLRVFPGKEKLTLLDHVGGWERHGLPDDDREWTLEGRKRTGKTKQEVAPGRRCERCYAIAPPGAAVCRECGTRFEVVAREVEQVDGELAEVDIQAARMAVKREQGAARDLDALRELARMRGYKPSWADHIWAARQSKGRARV